MASNQAEGSEFKDKEPINVEGVTNASGTISPKSLRFDPVDTVHYPTDPNVVEEESPGEDDDDDVHLAGGVAILTEGLVSPNRAPHPDTDTHKADRKKKKKRKRKRKFKDIRMAGSIVLCGRLRISRWIAVSLLLLFISTVIFLVAFVTNGWGTLKVKATHGSLSTVSWQETSELYLPNPDGVREAGPWAMGQQTGAGEKEWDDFWEFGLWQCCRNSDGVCLGTRWPLFYSATRAFCVLALFGHCLSLAWLVGNSVEQLLDYDVCTLATLATLCIGSGIFVLVAVCCFGARWPVDFRNEHYGTQPVLSFSFYLACITVPLTLAAGAFIIVDIQMGLKEIDDNYIHHRDDRVKIIDEHLSQEQGLDDVRGYGATYKSGYDDMAGDLEMVHVSR